MKELFKDIWLFALLMLGGVGVLVYGSLWLFVWLS